VPCEQEISVDSCGRAAGAVLQPPGAGAKQQMWAALRCEPTEEAEHRLVELSSGPFIKRKPSVYCNFEQTVFAALVHSFITFTVIMYDPVVILIFAFSALTLLVGRSVKN